MVFILAPIKVQNENSFKAAFLKCLNEIKAPTSTGVLLQKMQKADSQITLGAIKTYLGYGINNGAINRYQNGTTTKTIKGKSVYIYFFAPVRPNITMENLNTKKQNKTAEAKRLLALKAEAASKQAKIDPAKTV